MSFINISGGSFVSPSFPALLLYNLTAGQQIFLSWPSQFSDIQNQVAGTMQITAVDAFGSLVLPAVNVGGFATISPGTSTYVINAGAQPVTIFLQDATTALVVIQPGHSYFLVLYNNSNANGSWTVIASPGTPTVTSVGIVTGNANTAANLTIGNSPITSAGNIVLTYSGDIAALINFGADVGIATRIGVDSWALRDIKGTANQIDVSPEDGVTGDFVVSLLDAVVIDISLTAGNIQIGVGGANTISSQNANGNINLTPNGNGNVTVNLSPTGQLIVDSNLVIALNTTPAASRLVFNSITGTNYTSIQSSAQLSGSYQYSLPSTTPAVGQVMAVQTISGASPFVGHLEWASVTTVIGATTTNAVAVYANASGSLKNSVIIVDNPDLVTNFMHGVGSLQVGDIQLGVADLNTISTSTGNLYLNAAGVFHVVTLDDFDLSWNIGRGSRASFVNSGATAYLSLESPAGVIATVNYQIPPVDGAANAIMVTNGASAWSFSALTADVSQRATVDGVAKAWCTFDGTVAGTNAPASNFNVATVTQVATGTYTVNFAKQLSTATYGVFINTNGFNGNEPYSTRYGVKTQTTLTFYVFDPVANALVNAADISMMCIIQ